MMTQEQYNLECCNLLRKFKTREGLYNYYQRRLDTNKILNTDDELVIQYFIDNVDKKVTILEFAAGAGQVSNYLCMCGFTSIAINDYDPRRLRIAKEINSHFNNNACALKQGMFQTIDTSSYDYIFATNGGGSYLTNADFHIFETILNSNKKMILHTLGNNTNLITRLKAQFKFKIIAQTDVDILLFN